MPKLVKKPGSPYYYAWITDPDTKRKRRVSTKSTNLRTATAIAEGREREAFAPDRASGSTTLEKATHSFLSQHAAQKSAGTRHMYEIKTGQLLRVLGPQTPLGKIDAQAVDTYIAKRLAEGREKSTIGKELTALRGILKLARRHKLYPHALDEVMPTGWTSTSEPRERWCTAEEVWLIMAELLPHRAAVVAFIVATGARLGEAMRARREDVVDTRVVLRGTKTAGAKRVAPVMPWGVPFLEFALDNSGPRQLFADWTKAMRWDLKRVTEKLKLAPVSANDLRRTYGQWLRQAGVEPALIGITMGHADSRMVERVYGRVPVDKLRGLIDRQIDRTEEQSNNRPGETDQPKKPPKRTVH